MIHQPHSDQRYGNLTFSHCGEDLMVKNLFELMGISKPSYLDIGAHHPFNISNTALLYSLGSRGVNVEANPKLMEAFREHRPHDINVNIGVALETGMKTFYMWDDRSGRNTFNQEWADRLEVKGGETELQVTTLKDIVDTYCNGVFPDFLSIDIEGMDLPVLKSADFTENRPKIICVECWPADFPEFEKTLSFWGYFQYSRHAMDVIFVHSDYKTMIY